MRALVCVLLALVMTLPVQPVISSDDADLVPVAQSPSEVIDVLLMGVAALPADIEGMDGLEVVDCYETFVHIRAPQDTLDAITAKGHDLRQFGHLHEMSFNTITFDTRNGEPNIPTGLRDDLTDLYIVQLRGPAKEEWKEELASHGTILELVQHYAYIMRLGPWEKAQVQALDYVDWVGSYHPYYKIRWGFDQDAAQAGSNENVKAELIFYIDDREAYGRALGAIEGLGGTVLLKDEGNPFSFGARISMPLRALFQLARLDGLSYIEPYHDPVSRMDTVRWVVQSYDGMNETTPIWDHGIHGEGIIVGGADTGVDYSHLAFRNSTSDVGVPGPNHRKIVQYNDTIDSWDNANADNPFHGTKTMGEMIGNNVSDTNDTFRYDGIAFNAKLAFYDVVISDGTYNPPNMYDILNDSYLHGAESHSDSWGDDTTAYTTRSMRIDQFQWNHYEFLTFIAPGNSGKVLEPATAKNCVSVGNAYNGETTDIASSSAVGPANNNMTNPHIVAPGMNIITVAGDEDRVNANWGYTSISGTSASTPVAAGSTALIEQYFKDGFYPTGTKVPANGFTPSGPLKKAALLNSGWDQFGGQKNTPGDIGHAPNNQQGWGKIKLDDVLYFDGDEKGLWVYDGLNDSAGLGLATGEKSTFVLYSNSTEPLELTLVWNDYYEREGRLLNDLDLTVLDPSGNVYKGNHYQNGRSVPNGDADRANPEESILLDAPTEGFYIINVTAINIQSQVHQRFALVVTGSIHGAQQGGINFERPLFGIKERAGVRVVDTDLSNTGTLAVQISSLTETTPETMTLTETAIRGIFTGSMGMAFGTPKADGTLQVSDMDTLLVQYIESDPAGTRTATAHVDGKAPVITNVRVTDITNTTATVRWTTDEPADSNVSYGPSKAIGLLGTSPVPVTDHSISLTGLLQSTLYYFDVSSTDPVGNQNTSDNSGAHFTFRTASFIVKAGIGYAGWVREPEAFNHFDDGQMYSGFYVNLRRFSVFYFNISEVPENADIVAATIMVYGRSRAGTAPSGGTWTLELLDTDVNPLFNGSTKTPNYLNISGAKVDGALGHAANTDLFEDQWTTFGAPSTELGKLEERLPVDGIAMAIVGPTSGTNNMFSWDSGNSQAANSLGRDYAPTLILTVNLIPLVSPGAPSSLSIPEDTLRQLDLGTVFSDDGPLEYNITRPPEHLNAEVSEAVLNLTPDDDWNGDDYIIIKATDEDGLSSTHRINITVQPVDDAPVIVSIAGRPPKDGMVLNATQDQSDTFPVVTYDVDTLYEGDLIVYETNLSWAKVINGNLNITPSNDDVGTHGLHLTAKDLSGASDSVDLVVNVANVDDPPQALISNPLDKFKGYAGTPIELDGSLSTDPDLPYGDSMTFEWYSSLQGKLGNGATLAKALQAGAHMITLQVEDQHGSVDTATINITIWGDTDGDGFYDFEDTDDDGDGMPDYWETAYGLNPLDPSDAKLDKDGDKASNLKEYDSGTNPVDKNSRPRETPSEAGSWTALMFFVVAFAIGGLIIGAYIRLSGTGRKRATDQPRAGKVQEEE